MLWRDAGLTYLRYSQIAAQVARACTKTTGPKKAQATIVLTKWADGKPQKSE